MSPEAQQPVDEAATPAGERARKPIGRFALQAALLVALFGLLPDDNSAFARLLHAEANGLFGWAGPDRRVEFGWVDPNSRRDRSDTSMRGWVDGESDPRWRAVFSLRRRGYWPLAVWFAAVVATPMVARRRARAAAVGAIALNAFLLVELFVLAWCAFGASDPAPPGPDPIWLEAVPVVTAVFNSPVPVYALAFVLWAWLVQPAAAIDLSSTARVIRRHLPWAR